MSSGIEPDSHPIGPPEGTQRGGSAGPASAEGSHHQLAAALTDEPEKHDSPLRSLPARPTLPRLPIQTSLRVRLTFWYGVMLGITLLLFASFIYTTLTRNLFDEVDRSIADRSVEVNSSVRIESIPLRGPQITIPRPSVYATADIFVQISTLDGEVVTTSENLVPNQLPIDAADLAAARSGYSHLGTIEAGGEQLRVLYSPLTVANRPVGLLQVARALSPIEDTLSRLRLLLVAGIGLSLILAGIVGWALARTALAPIDRVTQTALEIGESRDFGRRVRYQGPADELGRLAATFNSMLGQLQGAYAELQAAYTRLEAALASQRRFVADASHELRTPLTTIRGNAGLLQQVIDMPVIDRQESIEQIASEADRMSRLVQDLLTLARADAGQHLRRDTVALGPLVREVARQAVTLARGVEIACAEVAEVDLPGNRDALKQLLLILVDNGLKYTPAGGVVTLRSRVVAAKVEISVADTGIGIAAADLPHVFERFYRADHVRSSGGTGLGLSIARWIAAEHRGQIVVTSEPERGSIFTVRLPLAPDSEG